MKNLLFILSIFTAFALVSCDGASTNSGSSSSSSKSGISKVVDAKNFKNLLDSKEYILIDVRTPKEFAQGHIPGAKNIALSRSFEKDVSSLDKSSKYLVYCLSGARANRVQKIMKNMGFAETVNLKGGIKKWVRFGFPFGK